MRRSLSLLIVLALAAPLVHSAETAKAREKDDKPRQERRVDPKQSTPEARAARKARDMNGGGRVLSVQPDENGHKVKVLKKGEVREIHVPDDDAPGRPPEHP